MIRSATALMVAMLMLTSTLAQDTPTDADIKTCYGCSTDQANYMCSPPASMTLKSKGGLICCRPGVNDGKSFCNSEKAEACTPSYASDPNRWWLACPQATKENCGGEKVITAYAEA